MDDAALRPKIHTRTRNQNTRRKPQDDEAAQTSLKDESTQEKSFVENENINELPAPSDQNNKSLFSYEASGKRLLADTSATATNEFAELQPSKKHTTAKDEAKTKHSQRKDAALPQKAPSNIRVTTRVDYAHGICKDYFETGFCGFGDACIFIHDRPADTPDDVLAAEWSAHRALTKAAPKPTEVASTNCTICKRDFATAEVSLLRAECGHVFCEECALARFAQTPKCATCGRRLNGAFKKATVAA